MAQELGLRSMTFWRRVWAKKIASSDLNFPSKVILPVKASLNSSYLVQKRRFERKNDRRRRRLEQ